MDVHAGPDASSIRDQARTCGGYGLGIEFGGVSMKPNRLLIGCIALGIAVVAGVAWPISAQTKGQSQATQHKEILKQMDDAQMTLAKATEAAGEESGGRAVGVRADIHSDKLVFTVQCSVGDELKPVT